MTPNSVCLILINMYCVQKIEFLFIYYVYVHKLLIYWILVLLNLWIVNLILYIKTLDFCNYLDYVIFVMTIQYQNYLIFKRRLLNLIYSN